MTHKSDKIMRYCVKILLIYLLVNGHGSRSDWGWSITRKIFLDRKLNNRWFVDI